MKIIMQRSYFGKTASGFCRKPYKVEQIEITRENYDNRASDRSIKFMNGFMGGSCRAVKNYTRIGYVPTQITLIAPDRAEKIVEKFTFTD